MQAQPYRFAGYEVASWQVASRLYREMVGTGTIPVMVLGTPPAAPPIDHGLGGARLQDRPLLEAAIALVDALLHRNRLSKQEVALLKAHNDWFADYLARTDPGSPLLAHYRSRPS